MADGAWSQSTCNASVWWYGIPGSGTWYWTQRYGQYWVGGAVYQIYAQNGWECGQLGPPVKAYGFISEFGNGGSEGVWFLGGAIVYRYDTRRWHVYLGSYGQTAGRLADFGDATDLPFGYVEKSMPEGDWSDLPKYVTPKAPKITAKMKALAR